MSTRAGLSWLLKLRFLPPPVRDRLRVLLFHATIGLFRVSDRFLGSALTSSLVLPFAAADTFKRRADYRVFAHLRAALPPSFWSCSPLVHFYQMTLAWQEALVITLLYERLGSRKWKARLTHTGAAPDEVEDAKTRPVVLVFMHFNGFPMIRYWLRARGIAAAILLSARPEISTYNKEILAAGDARFGLTGLEHFFASQTELRQAMRFLVPGHVLMVALDVGNQTAPYRVAERTVHLCDGAVRMAQNTGAILLPVACRHRGSLRFELRFGPPVPEELLRLQGTESAVNHLAREFWREIANNPTGVGWSILEALAPDRKTTRAGWP